MWDRCRAGEWHSYVSRWSIPQEPRVTGDGEALTPPPGMAAGTLRTEDSRESKIWSKIFLLSVAGFAVEVAWAVESCYAVPALLRSGLPERYASMPWALPPLMGILFQAWMGSASDRWGRRKPFILVLAMMSWLGMAMFAYGSSLSGDTGTRLMFVLVTFIFMDFALDQYEPALRMLLMDTVPVHLVDKANYTYSALLAFGSLSGSLISGVDWSSFQVNIIDEADEESATFDLQVQVVFGIALALFVACVAITMGCVREQLPYTSVQGETDSLLLDSQSSDSDVEASQHQTGLAAIAPPLPTDERLNGMVNDFSDGLPMGVDRYLAVSSAAPPWQQRWWEGLHCLSPLSICVSDIWNNIYSTVEFISYTSSATKLLWFMVILDDIVLLSLTIFLSDYVGVMVYGGSPMAPDGDPAAVLYERGLRVTCWARVAEDLVILFYSFFLERFSEVLDQRLMLVSCHIMLFFGLLSAALSSSLFSIVLVSLTSGLMWTNVASIPYCLLSFYGESGILLKKPWPHSSDTNGKAVSMIEMAFFLSQFLVAVCMGQLIDWFSLQAVIVVGMIAVFLSTVLSCWVRVDTSSGHGSLSPSACCRALLPRHWLVSDRTRLGKARLIQ